MLPPMIMERATLEAELQGLGMQLQAYNDTQFRDKPKPSKLLQLEDSLDGEDVIPNFNLPLSELFQELSF